VVLVVAKSPVVGKVKTRLGREVGMERAADLAAAALLDTVRACAAAYGPERCHLSLEGVLAHGQLADELLDETADWVFHVQRGEDFGERLVNAHEDASAASGAPVVQVGMDTPHLTARALREAGALLTGPDEAVLGPAYDGGWWLLGVGRPHLVAHLPEVPMSTADTGRLTHEALLRAGARVTEIESLCDVDEVGDAELVASGAPHTRFARSWR
jgi:glycosyltransferase A (GT-A) superfamily protein (DUF2064 family)